MVDTKFKRLFVFGVIFSVLFVTPLLWDGGSKRPSSPEVKNVPNAANPDVKPQIWNITRNVTLPTNAGPVGINATVYDADGNLDTVTLSYQVDGGAWTNQTKYISGTSWTGEVGVIPAQNYNANVEYYINVTDSTGRSTLSKLMNGGFEAGLAFWDVIGGSFIITDLPHSGTYSLDTSGGMINQTVGIPVSNFVNLSFWTNYYSSNYDFEIRVHYNDSTFYNHWYSYSTPQWRQDVISQAQLSPWKTIVAIQFTRTGASALIFDDINVATNNNYTVRDGIAPAISSPVRNPVAPNNTDPVEVNATITDADAGIASADLVYRVGGGSWQVVDMDNVTSNFGGTIPVQAYNAFVEYYVNATDNVGNSRQSTTESYTVQDVVVPVVSNVIRNPTAPNNTQGFDVSATVSDADSGIASADLYYRVDSGSWQKVAMSGAEPSYQGTIPVQSYDAFVEYYVNGTDAGENWAVSGTSSCTILDGVAPDISNFARNSTVVNCTQDVEASATISDPDIGVGSATLYYRVDGGSWQQVAMAAGAPYKATIPVQAYNAFVEYYINATDAAGNWQACSTASYTVVDAILPVISNLARDVVAPTSEQSVKITVSVTDADSGVASVDLYYRVNGGTWVKVSMDLLGTSYSATIPPQAANAVVEYYVSGKDVGGNSLDSSVSSYTVSNANNGGDLTLILSIVLPAGAAAGLFVAYKVKKQRIKRT